jgi:hypothetical protein
MCGATTSTRPKHSAKGVYTSPVCLTFNAKNTTNSLDYIFQLAVEMHKLGLPWVSEI